MLGSVVLAERIFRGFLFLGRQIFPRILSPDFFSSFLWGKSAQKNPPGKSPAKSSKTYTTKIPDNFLQRGRANRCGPENVRIIRKLEGLLCVPFFDLRLANMVAVSDLSQSSYLVEAEISGGGHMARLALGGRRRRHRGSSKKFP